MAPRLAFLFKDGLEPARVPVVFGMLVCADCRVGFMRRAGVRAAVERILESLVEERVARAKRPIAQNTVEMDLEWIPSTDPAYLHHKGLEPS